MVVQDPSIYSVKGIAILDNDGKRILAKYYDDTFPTVKEQNAFELSLFNKTKKANAEIILLDGLVCLYRSNVDLYFYVMGGSQENELILLSVLNCLYESVSAVLHKNVEKRALLDSLDVALLIFDEICDGGVILETEPTVVIQRVFLRGDESGAGPIGEQTVAQVGMQIYSYLKSELGTTASGRV